MSEAILIPQAAAEAPLFVFHGVEYMDSKGRYVQHRVTDLGTPPADWSEFIGRGEVSLSSAAGDMKQTFFFPLTGCKTLAECYAVFDAEVQRHGQTAGNQMLAALEEQKHKLVLPGMRPPPDNPPRNGHMPIPPRPHTRRRK